MPRQRLDGVRGVLCGIFKLQGCFVENLHIIGLESKLFFLQGVNQNSPKLQGSKDILTLVLVSLFNIQNNHFEVVNEGKQVPFEKRNEGKQVVVMFPLDDKLSLNYIKVVITIIK